MISQNSVYKKPGTEYNPSTKNNENTPYRTDIVRTVNDYDDLAHQLVITFKTYQALENKIAPLVSRNFGNDTFILSRDWIEEIVKNTYGMNSVMYRRFIDAIERFFIKYKSTRRLPSPHIISHRSVHFGEGLFEINKIDLEKYLSSTSYRVRNFKVTSVHMISVDGLEPFYIENMRSGKFKYLILRPKLGKAGTPIVDKWEILLYNSNPGYLVDHIDTDKNPRYNGRI